MTEFRANYRLGAITKGMPRIALSWLVCLFMPVIHRRARAARHTHANRSRVANCVSLSPDVPYLRLT